MSFLAATLMAFLNQSNASPNVVEVQFEMFERSRVQLISRDEHPGEWPFSIEEGFLVCTGEEGRVEFVEVPSSDEEADDREMRRVILSGAVGEGDRTLFAAGQSESELAVRVRPFLDSGAELCRHPEGVMVFPDGTAVPFEGF